MSETYEKHIEILYFFFPHRAGDHRAGVGTYINPFFYIKRPLYGAPRRPDIPVTLPRGNPFYYYFVFAENKRGNLRK